MKSTAVSLTILYCFVITGVVSNELQEAEVPVLSQSACQSMAPSDVVMGDSLMCAGLTSGGVDTCQVIYLSSNQHHFQYKAIPLIMFLRATAHKVTGTCCLRLGELVYESI